MIGSPYDTTYSALAIKLSQYLELEYEDHRHIAALESGARSLPAGAELVKQNAPYGSAAVVLEGWCLRYKLLPGGDRQVINFLLPGTFIGLHGTLFETADHAVSALTPSRIAFFDSQKIAQTFRERPRLALAISWDHAREEALIIERVASLGRRDAYERFAHLLVELALRLAWRTPQQNPITLPITQAVIADTLGLSLVHVSRTIQRLRDEGLIENSSQRGIVLRDLDGLKAVCGYDETYLHRTRLPEKTRKVFEN